MSRNAPIALIVALLVTSPGLAAEFQAGGLTDASRIEVLSSTPERTIVSFEVGRFQTSDLAIQGETWSKLQWEDGFSRLETGRPDVPGFRESLAVPDDARMELTILEAQYQDFPGIRVAPSKGPITRDVLPRDVPWQFGADYEADTWFPASTASLGEPYIMRDVRGVVVEIDPFQVNPVTETLRVWNRIVVEVRATGPGQANVLTSRPPGRVDEFERIYDRHFLNYGSNLRYAPVGEVGRMLVVAYDAFAPAVQPLVDWKNQMGIDTDLVLKSEVGSSASALKAYVQNAFDNDGVCFILLVGDAAQIPYYTNDGGAADPMMTLLAGSDSYPDAFIGRISAQTVAQVETQVERILEYERDPDPVGAWYSKGIAIASNEGENIGDGGEADWEHARNYRADLESFTYTIVNELYDGTHPGGINGTGGADPGSDAAGNPSAQDVADLLNEGRGLVHYTGHGSTWNWITTGFSSSNINALVNDNKLPFVVSVGCVNGAFMSGTCFAETWLRATHSGEPTGAVACYASTVNQQWATPMRAQDEMIDLMCGDDKRTWGGLCFNGSCDMIDRYGANGITEFKNWTIFGDPSLRVRTAPPITVSVSHAGSVDPAAGTFVVTTTPLALVSLSYASEYLGSAFADVAGVAVVAFDPADLNDRSEVTLTVTGFNLVPSITLIPVGGGSTSAPLTAGHTPSDVRPNPFGQETAISFTLEREQSVLLEVFDVTGRRIRTLRQAELPAGDHRSVWDSRNDDGRLVPTGSYFYRLTTEEGVEARRMVRLR